MGGTKQTYSDKLKSPLWQRKRLQVYERDNWTCQLCSDTTTELHVHHKYYISGYEPWEYELDNFMTLCKHCHAAVTIFNRDHPGDILKAIKRKVPLREYFSILLLINDQSHFRVAILTTDNKQMDLLAVVGQEAIDDINTLLKIDTDNLKTM